MRFVPFVLGPLIVVSCGVDLPAPSTGSSAGAAAVSGSSSVAGSSAGSGPMTPQAGGGMEAGAGTSGAGAGASGAGAGTSGAGAGGTSEPSADPFELLWRDDFDSFDTSRWVKASHTFPENLARFSADNVLIEGGLLKLRVTKVQSGDKPYSAAEIYSLQKFQFGRFEGRIKFCAGSGVVSSLFTYKEEVEQSWQEIDIEHLGNLPKSIQYNLIYGSLEERKYQPHVVTLTYAPSAEFHEYAIEWKPDGITFYIDGKQTHQDMQATIRDAATLRMNAWPTDNSVTSFAGPLDTDAIPCEAQYDWIQVFSYTP